MSRCRPGGCDSGDRVTRSCEAAAYCECSALLHVGDENAWSGVRTRRTRHAVARDLRNLLLSLRTVRATTKMRNMGRHTAYAST
jgi:hypothetical protein